MRQLAFIIIFATLQLNACKPGSDKEPIYQFEKGFGDSKERPVGIPYAWPKGIRLLDKPNSTQDCFYDSNLVISTFSIFLFSPLKLHVTFLSQQFGFCITARQTKISGLFATYLSDMTLVSLENVLLADYNNVATFADKAECVFLIFKLGLVIVIKDSVVT